MDPTESAVPLRVAELAALVAVIATDDSDLDSRDRRAGRTAKDAAGDDVLPATEVTVSSGTATVIGAGRGRGWVLVGWVEVYPRIGRVQCYGTVRESEVTR